MTALSLAAWAASVDGKTIGSGECYALWQDYLARVIGAPDIPSTQATAHPNYAIGLFDGYAVNGASAWFEKLGPTEVARSGDVAFWAFGADHPEIPTIAASSHVAMVFGDALAALDCESQNSPQRFAQRQLLPKLGLAGYFRPRENPGTPGVSLAAQITTASSNSASSVLDAANSLGLKLSQPAFWRRAGVMVLGAVLLAIVLINLIAPALLPDTMKVGK